MKSIFKKEVISTLRDYRLVLLVTAMFLLVVSSLFTTYTQSKKISLERQQLNQHLRQQWDSLKTDPHSASHYGKYVFTQRAPLSFFDLGITSYVGSFLKVEAHTRNEPQFSQANESSAAIRFGELSAARVLQMLLPLLLIFMGYDTIGKEREQGTFKLMLAQGISIRKILWQKIGAYFMLSQAIIIPVFVITLWFHSASLGYGNGVDVSLVFLLFVIYTAYSFILITIIVSVSVSLKESRNALLTLLGIWLVFTIFLPKIIANVGDGLHPLPSKKKFQLAIEEQVEKGIDGHNPGNVRTQKFVDSVLQHYQVNTVAQLPINIDGALMQADEHYRDKATKKQFAIIKETIQKQNYLTQWAAWLSPFLSVRDLSMGICATDYFKQAEYERQVQHYRLELMRTLNNYMTTHSQPGDWGAKAEAKFYQSIPDFVYHQPAVWWSIQHYRLTLLAFAYWLVMCFLFVEWSARNTKII